MFAADQKFSFVNLRHTDRYKAVEVVIDGETTSFHSGDPVRDWANAKELGSLDGRVIRFNSAVLDFVAENRGFRLTGRDDLVRA